MKQQLRTFKVTVEGQNYWFEADAMSKAYDIAKAIKLATNARSFTVVEYSQKSRHDGETLFASLPNEVRRGLC